jgi:glycosyltransferase involved in cell wall biosynthesis
MAGGSQENRRNRMPEVSVIIPTFNRAHMIEKAIFSVLRQTYKDLELIIVDDGSVDDTPRMVAKINDDRLTYFRHEKQKGAAEARNTGVTASSGRFLAFLDDDDEWLPDKLDLQMEVFGSNPEIGMVYTGYYYVNAENNEIFREFHPKMKGRLDDRLLMENCVGTTSTAVIRKDCFEKVGGFDVCLRGSQDWDLWIRIAEEYPIEYVARPLVKFLNHDLRITHNLGSKIQGKERLLEKIHPLIKDKPKILSNHYFVIGFLYCANGDVENGREKLLKAIKLNPLEIRYYKHYIPALFGSSFYKYLSSKRNKFLITPKNS